MSNRIIRNLPDSKYKAVVGNTLAGGSNPFGTESEITDVIETTIEVNGLTIGIQGTSADAARHILGSSWRMPTLDEWIELTNTCTMTWTTVEGINGYLVSNNGNSIFLPASGYREKTSTYSIGTEGHYWTGDAGGGETAAFGAFDATNPKNSGCWVRPYGRSIRPVSNTEGVDLGLSVKWASVNLGATNPQDYGDFFAWGELETKTDFAYNNYICPSGSYETENDPITHVTKSVTSTVLHKDNTAAHLNPVKEARWDGKQDALGFTPENVANKKTTLDDNSDTYYPTQKAVKTAVDAKVTGAASSVANEVPVYDGTTGKVLKSGSGVSAVGGNLTIGGTITANGQQILPQKQADWNQTTSTGSDYIKNKPALKAGQGEKSIIEGNGTTASGDYSHTEGNGTTASGSTSHAEGGHTTASGDNSHAEGLVTTASGSTSHAEGGGTTASGDKSHAEGNNTTASGNYSHAEGSLTKASGYASHAEGNQTTASGDKSHAEGGGTTAKNRSQHVFGEFNTVDPSSALSSDRGNYVEIVGKGTDNTHRSNARTLDWSGNEVLAGKITANGVNLNDALNLKQDVLGFTPENSANKKTTLDDNSDTYYPTQKAVKTAVDAKADDTKVAAIQGLIPTQASPTNQLTDKDFVNSSIGTSTAIFRGTFTSVDELPTTGVDNNDYAFVKVFDSIQTDEVLRYDRYKWSDGWSFEYSLNNSSFTAAQWNAINSNATASIISDLLSHASNISNPHAVTKSQVGLGDVDNTSDLNKPLSTAAVAEFATKQDALGFTPENVANKITDMSNPIAGQYADAQTIKTFVADAVAGINDFISSGLEMMTAFESCSSLAYGPTKLEVGPWYKNGVSETTNINKGDWAIVLADETVCWFTDGVFKYQRFKDNGLSPFGFVVLSSGTAVAGTKGVNACIEIGEGGVVMSYIYTEVVGENTYICFLDNSANTVVWKVQSLSNTIGAVHKYINSVEQEDVYDLNLPTTRYICSGLNGDIPIWALLYIVKDQPLTQAQWNAINSTITKAWKDQADIDIAALLLHIADGTIHPTAEKQLEWDGKEDGVVRLAEDGDYSSGYAEISGFNTEGSYAIIITSSAYGHVQASGIIFYSKGVLPKAVGYCPAKYNGKIFISSAGYSKERMVVLDLDKTYPFAGTITHVAGSYDSVTGEEIEDVSSAYEKIANRTNSINSNSTSEEYPSAKAVYDFTKIKSKNFTGSGGSTDIKFAFIPFNANALFSFQRESGAFGEGLMYIRTNNTTVERVVCDSSFRTYDTYFYETSGGVVLCYNVDAEPYNITISTIYDSSGECVLGTTKSLGTQINVDLVKMQESLTSDSTIDISNNVISAVGCKEVIRDTNPISRDLQPNIFTNCKLTVSSWNPICQNHITGIECEYKGRFIANTIFTVGGTDWEGNAITWSGDKDCIASGVYEFSIIDNYGIIIKMN